MTADLGSRDFKGCLRGLGVGAFLGVLWGRDGDGMGTLRADSGTGRNNEKGSSPFGELPCSERLGLDSVVDPTFQRVRSCI